MMSTGQQRSIRSWRCVPNESTTNERTFIIADLKVAPRILLKTPGFALIAAFTLALGIGANSAIFSVINTVLLRRAMKVDPMVALPYE